MVLRHADVPWGVHHFSISALPSTVGNIRESMRSSVVQHFLEFTDFFHIFHVFNMKVNHIFHVFNMKVNGKLA